jgi:hypothetical protein
MKVFFKANLLIWLSHFQTQQLKSYSWFIFPIFDQNFVQNDFIFEYWGSNKLAPAKEIGLKTVIVFHFIIEGVKLAIYYALFFKGAREG